MANDLTNPPKRQIGDGFAAPSSSGNASRGSILSWNDKKGWTDRDGLTPPSPLLVVDIDEVLRRWKDRRPIDIVEKPPPDCDALNATIPKEEWGKDYNGDPEPPFAQTVIVYYVDLNTGERYSYANKTAGAHIAFNILKDAVTTTWTIRGTRCLPLVNLEERPMPLKGGAMGKRPHHQIVGYKVLGEDAAPDAAPTTSEPDEPQLSGPAAAPTPTPTPEAPVEKQATPVEKSVQPESRPTKAKPRQSKPKAKPAVNLTAETLQDAEPITTKEILDDEIGW